MRLWMEKIKNDAFARNDFAEWIEDQSRIHFNGMHTALLEGKIETAVAFAHELVVYQRLYQRFTVEEENERAESERRLNNG